MNKNILQALPELVKEQVITEETATRIRQYYQHKPETTGNRLFIVFGIIGALLVGLGIVLIIAHNWDDLSKTIKLSLALLPLLVAQVICAGVCWKIPHNIAWRESSSVFLMLSIAAGISIISQVYNIDGTLAGFLLLWMALSLPVIYVMRSSLVSMLVIIGTAWYGCEVSYFHYLQGIAWWYWVLTALTLPWYLYIAKKNPRSNYVHVQSWLLAFSVVITLGMFGGSHEELMLLTYLNVFGVFVCAGQLKPFSEGRLITNAPLVIGSLGTIAILLTLSFKWFWTEIHEDSFAWREVVEFPVYVITDVIAAVALAFVLKQKAIRQINLKSITFIVTSLLFFIALSQPVLSQVSINILVFGIGVATIRDGAHNNRLSILNYGLLILTALITCRFFDMNVSFVIRGLLFIGVGAGFFVANFWMIKRRKTETILPE